MAEKLKLILRLDELLHVFSDEIRFDVDFITNATGPQISMLQGERDNRDCEASTATFIYSQANPVHSNRTFRYQESSQLHRDMKRKKGKLTKRFYGFDNCNPIYVPGNQMAPSPILESQWSFEIDQAADSQHAAP